MLAAVIGGGLQGVEASYLAKKAGWDVLVIDKNSAALAQGLCDSFVLADVRTIEDLDPVFKKVDLVIPALEDDAALKSLCKWHQRSSLNIAFAFDREAYKISSSKIRSNHLFADLDIPRPLSWPGCEFPILAKPSSESGSKNIMIFNTRAEIDQFNLSSAKFHQTGKWVIQEYISGPSYSLEIMGMPGSYQTFQVTELEIDKVYDCKRVIAPAILEEEKKYEFELLTRKIAHAVKLAGIMDVEVIFHDGRLKVLEIDARLPSQTPIAVYHSSGINMFQRLADLFLKIPVKKLTDKSRRIKHVILEHVRVTPQGIYVEGEHIMKGHGMPLHVKTDFFGADEAITNYKKGKKNWVATLIIKAGSPEDTSAKRKKVIQTIKNYFSIKRVVDVHPY